MRVGFEVILKELFLEIGTEEIPAGFIPKAMEEMDALVRKEFSTLRISHGEVKSFGTPRRLVLSVQGLAERQENISVQVMGPAKKAAYDDKGNLTKAAEGFARSQGVEPSALKVVQTPKGEYIALQKEEKGRDTSDILKELLPRIVSSIQFRKSMRWADLDVRFARPVHWIVALFGGEVVPFSFGNVKSGNESRGHRFMSPATFKVSGLDDYMTKTKGASLIVDQAEREKDIRSQISALADSANGSVTWDTDLLKEITFINEYPVGVIGGFEKEFLELPDEVLITSMKKHQKYFYLRDGQGKLLPNFITISNTRANDMAVVRKGNERVLRARLSDARFFYSEDKKITLEERVERLKGIVFQVKLGTIHEKVVRFSGVAAYLAEALSVSTDEKETIKRTALLCKADLVTGMVGEFPELQGIMGREYARVSGERSDVSAAIEGHYLPRFAGDAIPPSTAGAVISISDRIDTICGCFGIGQMPTGTADPFALRRHAIAIINIILSKGYRISMAGLADRSLSLLDGKITRPAAEVRRDVLEFIKVRLENILTSEGHPQDVVDAVLSAECDDLVRSVKIVKALSVLKKSPEFEPLAVAFKRGGNIIKGTSKAVPDRSLFQHRSEEDLFAAVERVREKVAALAAREEYDAVFTEIATFKGPVDAFFEGVMVMDKDERVKNNRLALLWGVCDIFERYADFSRITTAG